MISKDQLADEYLWAQDFFIDTHDVRKTFLAGYTARDAEVASLVEALGKLCGAASDCLINDEEEREEAIQSMREDIRHARAALAAYRAGKEKE